MKLVLSTKYLARTAPKYILERLVGDLVCMKKEHRKDVNTVTDYKFTRSRKKDSTSEYHPSALTDHVAQYNHTIDWDNVRLPFKESDWRIRGIKEAILIRKSEPNSLNRDGGRHQLPDCYNRLLVVPPSGKLKH